MREATLRAAERDYRSAVKRAETLRAKRNGFVAAALLEGWTHARIAEATGLTRGRIGQIAQSLQAQLQLSAQSCVAPADAISNSAPPMKARR